MVTGFDNLLFICLVFRMMWIRLS